MSDITNADRAAWTANAIDAFTAECRMDGEDKQTKAKDLITNLVHYLRHECDMTRDEARSVVDGAVRMAEAELIEDDEGLDEEPELKTFPVRLWITARMVCETEVEAASMEDAIAKAKELDFADYDFVYEQQEGDETAYIAAPDDELADPVEVDLREEGEPFSWEAVNIVKDLASFYDRTFSSNDIVSLLARAHRCCTKITGGMEG